MNDLTERLAHQAEEFERRGGTALHLDEVLDRAGEIRRGRRLRATLVMAAAVLAIAVPAALLATHRDVSPEPQPAAPTKVDTSPITLANLDRGDGPARGWMAGNVWHRPDGSEFTWSGGRVVAATLVGDGTLVESSGDQGERAYLVPPVGSSTHQLTSWPIEGGVAVSDSGDLAAFVQPDGTPVVVSSTATGDPERVYALPLISRGSGFQAVAVDGQGCRASVKVRCRVWVSTHGSTPETWTSSPGGSAQRTALDFTTVSDVDATGARVAGMTRVSDSGSCSGVGAPFSRPTWTTCEHQLGSFSPDGKHLTGLPAYTDGAGSSELAVLDASTGQVVLDLHTAKDAFVGQVVWEDDTHLLAAVADAGRWAVLRIGLGGSREYAVPPVTSKDPYESPFVLPSR